MKRKIIVFTYKTKEEEKELVKKCLGILETEYQLLNIPQYKIEQYIKSYSTNGNSNSP